MPDNNNLGFTIRGMFIGSDVAEYEGKTRYSMGVAVGLNSYRVYLSSPDGLEGLGLGDFVTVSCRPYAGKRGLGFSDGVIL